VDAVAKAERRARDAEERCRELAEVDRSSASSAVNQAAESVTTLRHQLDTKQQELVEEQVKLARVTEQLEQLQLRRDREAAAAEESDRKLWQRITELEIANSSTTKSPEAEPDTPTPTHLPSGTASSGELAVCKARVTEVEAELAEARDNCKEFEAKAVEAKRRAEALERALEACSADAEAHRRRVELLEECKHDSEAADEGKQTGGMNRQLLLVQQEAEAAAQAADLRQAELSNRIAELSLAKAEAEQRCTTAESKAELIRQECEAALKAAETRSTELELRVAELALEKAEAEQRAEAMEVLLQEAKRHSAEDEAPPRPNEQPSAQPSDKPPMNHKSESVSSEDSDGVEPIAPVVPKLNLAGVAPGSAPSQAPVIPKLALGKITPSAASDGPPLAPRGGPTPSPKSTTPRASPRNSTALPGTGLTVWGGPDGLIYVAEIRAGGPAERSRIIQLGDIILAVNDVNLKKKSPDKAAQLVSKAKGIIQLTIAHRAPDPGQTTPRDTERVFLQRDGGGDWA